MQRSPFLIQLSCSGYIVERKGDEMAKKEYSLAHTKWMCKYHIVFTPKYRRKIIYNQLKVDIRDILKQLCSYKGVEIIEGHLMPDHIHMLLAIPPKYSVSSFMGYLKGKSALMIFDRHANLKYKFGNRHFWAEGYYVSTVGLNEATIKKYIQEQEKQDIMKDKLSVKEYDDPFKGKQ
jgi:putative transposase